MKLGSFAVVSLMLFGTAAWAQTPSPTVVPSVAPSPAPSAFPIPTATPNTLTHSGLYQSLEEDSSTRKAFIKSHNQSTISSLQASPNYIPTQNLIYQLFDHAQVIKQVTLDSTRVLKLVNRGLGKSTDLVLSTTGGADEVLVSNFQLFGITVVNEIVDFDISPDQKLIYIVSAKDGSIDEVTAQFYDFVNRKTLPNTFSMDDSTLFWATATTLFYEVLHADGTRAFFQYDVTTQVSTPLSGTNAVIDSRAGYLITYMNHQYNLHDKTTGMDTQIFSAIPKKIISVDANFVYLLTSSADSNNEVRAFKRNSAAADAGTAIITASDHVIRSVLGSTNGFFVNTRNGADRTLRAYDGTGAIQGEILIPNCCSLANAVWVDPTVHNAIKLTLLSAVHSSTIFTYDLVKKTWDRDPNVEMMTLGSAVYTTTIESTKSLDGTILPVRLTMLTILTKNQTNPVVFQSYGGFGLAGNLDPVYDQNNLEFIKRGGILAGPALRGGNEFDGTWRASAMRLNKIKTYQDLSAAAQFLSSEGWTTPAKIVSMGTSNGGLTVAATALLFPNTFGLVIPAGGVHDLLARDRLDAPFQGWDSEFGSDSDASMIPELTSISPLENTTNQGNTAFLILDGRDDTRVNIAHSLKLTAALEAETGSHAAVNLLSVSKSGHWLQSNSYSNMKAWFTDTAIWTKIFDLAGWTISAQQP